MIWHCHGCGHDGPIGDFFVLFVDEDVRDYRCPRCGSDKNEHLAIPRIDLTDRKSGQKVKFYVPTPKQVAMHLSRSRNLLWGGRAGTGKSHGLRMDAYMRCLTIPGYRVLLLRRQFTELKDTHLDKAAYEAEKLGAVWRASDYTVIFSNGSRLRFGHCETDASVSMYLSSEFDAVFYDEGSTFTEYSVRFINSRLRTAKKGVIPIVRIGSNPGAMWLYRTYISKDITKEEDPSYNPENYEFIPAEITDNPHVNLEEQQMRLNALPSEALRKMYRDGDWNAVEGQFFTDWMPKDRETGKPWHVISELPCVKGVPITEVPWVEYSRGVDWGFNPDPGVVLWVAHLPNDRYVVVKEFTFNGKTPRRAAEEIKERSEGLKVRYTVMGADSWTGSRDTGESVAETFARAGVSCRPADMDRLNGWERLSTLLRETVDDGTGPVPRLQVYGPGCPLLVRTLPMMQCDPKRIGDVRQQDDHHADALRYWSMSRPSSSRDTRKSDAWKRLPKEVRGMLLRQGTSRLGSESVRRR